MRCISRGTPVVLQIDIGFVVFKGHIFQGNVRSFVIIFRIIVNTDCFFTAFYSYVFKCHIFRTVHICKIIVTYRESFFSTAKAGTVLNRHIGFSISATLHIQKRCTPFVTNVLQCTIIDHHGSATYRKTRTITSQRTAADCYIIPEKSNCAVVTHCFKGSAIYNARS